jgi:hypothetical protein
MKTQKFSSYSVVNEKLGMDSDLRAAKPNTSIRLVTGSIISGEIDEYKQFSLREVITFITESTIKESQLKRLYDY